MIVGSEYGGLRQDEFEALLKMIDENGWSLCHLYVETVDKCATGVVTVRMVQNGLRKEYEAKYVADKSELDLAFANLCGRHTKT
jgi:hypothetical protein